MTYGDLQNWVSPFGGGMFNGMPFISLVVFLVWSLIWKGLALWRAGQRGEKWWFIAILIINTIGILEILYLYVFSKKENLTGTPDQPKGL